MEHTITLNCRATNEADFGRVTNHNHRDNTLEIRGFIWEVGDSSQSAAVSVQSPAVSKTVIMHYNWFTDRYIKHLKGIKVKRL